MFIIFFKYLDCIKIPFSKKYLFSHQNQQHTIIKLCNIKALLEIIRIKKNNASPIYLTTIYKMLTYV